MKISIEDPRILMFVPQYPFPVLGGLERQSHELSKTLLHRLGVPVRVLSGKVLPSQPDHEKVEGVCVTRLNWPSMRLLRFMRTPIDVMANMWFRRNDYDVIHLHQHSWVGLFVILVACQLKKPILTKLPNVGELGIPGLRKQVLGRLRLAILLRSNGIVAMSETSVEELLSVGYPAQRILTVPNGISMLPNDLVRRRSNELSSVCRVVFVGRLSSEKRLDTLLQAWAELKARIRIGARLEFWGDGPQAYELKQRCVDLGVFDSVYFAGQVVDVRAQLRGVDIFVLPSMCEGNSNAVLEAMEAGLPIVATPVGGTPMQVGPEGAPLLFPVGDTEQLTERLSMLISDSGLRRIYGNAMHRRIAAYFNLEKVAVSYLCAYRILANNHPVDFGCCGQLPSNARPCAG